MAWNNMHKKYALWIHPYTDESDFAILLQYYCNNIAKSDACACGSKFLVRNFAIGFNCNVIANDFAITLQLK